MGFKIWSLPDYLGELIALYVAVSRPCRLSELYPNNKVIISVFIIYLHIIN